MKISPSSKSIALALLGALFVGLGMNISFFGWTEIARVSSTAPDRPDFVLYEVESATAYYGSLMAEYKDPAAKKVQMTEIRGLYSWPNLILSGQQITVVGEIGRLLDREWFDERNKVKYTISQRDR